MAWKGTIQASEASGRRPEREEQRRFRKSQQQTTEVSKLSALNRARLEVEMYESRLEVLRSIHKEQVQPWDWRAVSEATPPVEPRYEQRNQEDATALQAPYRPGLFDRLFGTAKKQSTAFRIALDAAKDRDDRAFEEAQVQYRKDLIVWEDERQLALSVLAGSSDAYSRILQKLMPFAELTELGSSLTFQNHSAQVIGVSVKMNGDAILPCEIKSLTAAGKVSSKIIPKVRYNEIYADYLSGSVLRIGREIFALLPVDTVLVTVLAGVFDSRTGHTPQQPILSVALTRPQMDRLNYSRLDASDAMENFLRHGDFKAPRKSGAFVPIVPLTPADLKMLPGSRAAAANETSASTLAVPPLANPIPAKWAEALRRNRIEYGFLRLTANELAALLGKPVRDSFTLPESKALAQSVEALGYCLEPDPRYGGGPLWGLREIGLFQALSGRIEEPSDNFLGGSALLQLCFLVAAADGAIHRSELDPYQQFIESHFKFSPDEHQRMVVLETLLTRDTAGAKVTLGRTAKRVPQDKHLVIAQFLVEIAAADGTISPKERKALAQIFEALGLNEGILDALVRNLSTEGRGIVTQTADTTKTGEVIPPPTAYTFRPSLSLDMSRVAAITAETHEVIGLLAKAMSEDEPTLSPSNIPPSNAAKPWSAVPQFSKDPTNTQPQFAGQGTFGIPPEKLTTLDPQFHAVLHQLVDRETWSRAELEALAREHRLMAHGLLVALNEWADESLGDFLLDGEELITVHRHLLKS